NKYTVQGNYEIDGIREAEKLEFEGEDRYQGELIFFSEKNNKLSLTKMELNPVSFYFTAEELELPLLVDKDKDGFTFCKKCGRLYWELIDSSHQEYKHKEDHILPVKYLVKINR
ncbi:MAG: hypothetical protein ACOC4G_14905, partial [Bacillota bacterium]